MTDACRIVAELRAHELFAALLDAVEGAPNWRPQARRLLHSIADLELPEQVTDALRAVDERKRCTEVMHDVMWSDCSG